LRLRCSWFFALSCFFGFQMPISGTLTSTQDTYLNSLQSSLLHNCYTHISDGRFYHLKKCMEEVEHNHIPGDFIETGVWKGGVTIFMKGFLSICNNQERRLWVADSFQGFPPTNRFDEAILNNQRFPEIAVALDNVKANFFNYDFLDGKICFLEGFFSETLPMAPIDRLAILRLDGDLYESTMDALVHLYPKLSIGGYVIIDDYGYWPGCAKAVEDYRKEHNITEEWVWEDETAIHWKKTRN